MQQESVVEQFLQWLIDNWKTIAVILALFVEITPIKIKPITGLLRWIGNKMFASTNYRLDAVESIIDTNEKDRIRYEVLSFANSCRQNIKHTKDEYEHIIVLKEKYDKLLRKTNDTNGVFVAEYEYILEVYKGCQRNNDFL